MNQSNPAPREREKDYEEARSRTEGNCETRKFPLTAHSVNPSVKKDSDDKAHYGTDGTQHHKFSACSAETPHHAGR